MARSHVKECVREGFDLTDVEVDSDGDVPLVHGTAVYYLSLSSDGSRVKAWSWAVRGVKATPALLRELNDVNAGLERTRVFARKRRVLVEGTLDVPTMTPETLRGLCVEVGRVADDVGSMISAVHGGTVALPDGNACGECGGQP